MASRIESLAFAFGIGGEETIVGRSGRALVGTTIAIVIIGLPLMRATQMIVALSLPH